MEAAKEISGILLGRHRAFLSFANAKHAKRREGFKLSIARTVDDDGGPHEPRRAPGPGARLSAPFTSPRAPRSPASPRASRPPTGRSSRRLSIRRVARGPGSFSSTSAIATGSSWNALAAELAAKGFHVLTLDYRGYGESGGTPFNDISVPGAGPDHDGEVAGGHRRRLRVPAGAAGRAAGRDRRRRRQLRRQQLDPALASPSGGEVPGPPLGRHRPQGTAAPEARVGAADPLRGRGRRRRRRVGHDLDRRDLGQQGEPVPGIRQGRARHGDVQGAPGAAGPDRGVVRAHAHGQGPRRLRPAQACESRPADAAAHDDGRAGRCVPRGREPGRRAQEGSEVGGARCSLREPARLRGDPERAMPKAAIAIMQVNVDARPSSSNAWDSLGDAYLADGQREKAREASEKSPRARRFRHVRDRGTARRTSARARRAGSSSSRIRRRRSKPATPLSGASGARRRPRARAASACGRSLPRSP